MEQQNWLGCHVEMVAPGKPLDSSDENHKKYISSVEELADDRLLLAMPMYRGVYAPMHKEERYDTYIFVKAKIFQCRVVVQGAIKEGNKIILVTKVISSFTKYERREFFRLDCTMEVYSRKLDAELVDIYRQYLKEGKEMLLEGFAKGTAIDLSAGGMKFISGERLQPKQAVLIRFTVNQDMSNQTSFMLLAHVIESSNHPSSSGVFIQRVAFEMHSDRVRENLVSFIFQQQRKNLRKE